MKYKCVIFDCDGVLVDSVSISNQVLIDMAKSVGLHMDMELAMNMFSGASLMTAFEYIESKIETKLPDSFEKEFRTRTFEAFKKNIKPINGVRNAIEQINVPYCVASSGPVNKIKLNLTVTNLIDKFDDECIFSSYQINSWKPEPGIFLHAANKMGFSPNECVVVEDTVEGIKAAKAGGFNVFGYVDKSNKNLLKNEDVLVFNDMNNLNSLLTDTSDDN